MHYFQTNYNFAVSLTEAHVYKANKLGLSVTICFVTLTFLWTMSIGISIPHVKVLHTSCLVQLYILRLELLFTRLLTS